MSKVQIDTQAYSILLEKYIPKNHTIQSFIKIGPAMSSGAPTPSTHTACVLLSTVS